MNKNNLWIKSLLVGTLLFARNVNAENISLQIEDNLPKRILYLNEQNQIYLIRGNDDAQYSRIKIFKEKKEVGMSPEIDYQYQKIKPKLSFNKDDMCTVQPVAIPKPLVKSDGKPYSGLELEVINRLYEKDVLYPCRQITEALEKSNITELIDGDKWYVTFYPDESNEQISLERIE